MSETTKFRVAVVGAGPAGFYACEELLKSTEPSVEVHLYDRLPSPYGLVRYGVAPDHPKIKNVVAVFDKVADSSKFRYFGNVEVGKHVTVEELRKLYHCVIFTVGALADRHLDIPGEQLEGSYPATAFVAWYNGHPDFRHCQFDLSHETAAVVGMGNVALDVARILCSTPEELEKTDIADYALEALRHSQIRHVHILGRRGPIQAAFTNIELKELEELKGVDFQVLPDEIELDPISQQAFERDADKQVVKRMEILRAVAARAPQGRPRQLTLRFLVSPVELLGQDSRLRAVRFVRNRLNEKQQAVSTGEEKEIALGLLFRSVGYKGSPMAGLPFNDKNGTVPNVEGRVVDGSQVVPGVYVAGWIKRGSSGVIGTNKPCAKESVQHMLDDLRNDRLSVPEASDVDALLKSRGVRAVDFAEWKFLDRLEQERGKTLGRPRQKITSVEEMLSALEGASVGG